MLLYNFALHLETEVQRGQTQGVPCMCPRWSMHICIPVLYPRTPPPLALHTHPGCEHPEHTGPARSTSVSPGLRQSRIMAQHYCQRTERKSIGADAFDAQLVYPLALHADDSFLLIRLEGNISAREPFLAEEAHLARVGGRWLCRGLRLSRAQSCRAREKEGCGFRRGCLWLSSEPPRGRMVQARWSPTEVL